MHRRPASSLSLARLWALLLVLAGPVSSSARADQYDPPASYYSTATGTGATLKSQLHNIIDDHTNIGYDAARTALQVTDADVSRAGYMITVYDRTSLNVAAINPGGPVPGWDNAATWNREHTWPRSRGIDNTGPDDSDLFNLRPALTAGNGDRANYNFGGAFGSQSFGLVTAPNPDMWYPGNADAGMIARQQFYMAVRYDGSDASTTNLELAAGNPAASTGTLGDKDRLIEWNYAAPPDAFERRRNQVIYDQYQHNRNPFTDRPEWVWSVFVDNANDSSLTLAGGVASAGGATTLNLDFGRRIVGAPLPAAQSVTLSKAGVDGTYYSVSAAGAAASSISGRYNAFRVGSTGAQALSVGLAAGTSTAAAGLQSGTVTIDNLDVTTAGGAAAGANDGNDLINVALSVLDHANPSFAGVSDLDTLTIDFGTAVAGAPAPTFNFSLFNLPATAGYTAGLDLDGVFGSGDSSALTTNLATFGESSSLAAGASRMFVAALDTSTAGDFAASYTLSFSDENLPGAAGLGSLTLNLMGIVMPATAANADFNGDFVVDGADFLAWQRGLATLGPATVADGDANGDHAVDGLDLAIWQEGFAVAGQATAIPAPEPTTLALFIAALGVEARRTRRRCRQFA